MSFSLGGALHALKQLRTDPFKGYNFSVIVLPDLSCARLLNAMSPAAAAGMTLGAGIGSIAAGAAAIATGAAAALGGFTSIRGIGWETEVHAVRQGGENHRVRKLPGRTACGELIFTKGLTLLDPMSKWYQLTLSGNVLRMNGTIFLMTDDQTPALGGMGLSLRLPAAAWNFYHAWPRKLDGVQLDASNSAIAVQELTLAVEKIQKII